MCYKNELEDCEPAPQRAAGPTLAIGDLASEYYVSAGTVLVIAISNPAAEPRVALTDEAPDAAPGGEVISMPKAVKSFPCPLLSMEKH